MASLYEMLSFYELKNVVDLLNLYTEINLKCIDHGKNTCSLFAQFTQVLVQIISVLKKINIVLDGREQQMLD